jgi:polyferredoxin
VHHGLDVALTSLKYLVLAFFFRAIVIGMDKVALHNFMNSTYNYGADAKMLLFFTDLSRTTAVTLIALAALSIIIKNFWCRYLCPYGALLGLVSWISPQRVVRDAQACTDCKACTRACPVEITVHKKTSVWTPECTGCMSCVTSCPVEDCLTVTKKGETSWSPWYVPAVGLATIFFLCGIARVTGHWQTELSLQALVEAYRQADTLIHP